MAFTSMVQRLAAGRLQELLAALRVVVMTGPRQAGKTTLLQACQAEFGGEYRTLDDADVMRAARADPETFVRIGGRPMIIDEVQRGGDPVVLAIKGAVDADQARGQFVLSGSTDFLTVPTLSESLAGRAGFVDLWPFCMTERTGGDGHVLAAFFDQPQSLLRGGHTPWTREDYLDTICLGGYPEATEIGSVVGRRAWFDGYLATVVSRDIGEFAEVHRAQIIPDLLTLIAARSGSPLVVADIAKSLEVSASTVRNYVSYLEMVYLIRTVPPWSTNLTSKVAKASKLFLTDSGLAARRLGVEREALRAPGHPALGALAETFVYTELVKLASFIDPPITIRHFRDRDGHEVDFILEARDGRVVGLEVKASVSPSPESGRHLGWLRDKLDDRFAAGFVLYMGDFSGSIGDRLYMAPMSVLWDHAPL